jgi:hypothetical protein
MVRPGVSGVLLRRAKHFLSSDCLCGVNDSQEQAANAGAQQWDYCVPKPNYAEVRARVGSAFAEKAHELADAVAVVQGLSKEATRLPRELFRHFLALPALWMEFIVRIAAQEKSATWWKWQLLSMICLLFAVALCRLLGEIDKQCS